MNNTRYERKRYRGRKKKTRIILLVLLIILAILSFSYYKISSMGKAVDINNKDLEVLEIKKGMSNKEIGKLLKKNGFIRNDKYFLYYIKSNNKTNLKAGKYELSKSYDVEKIANLLNKGSIPNGEKITIKEGFNVEDIGNVLYSKGIIDDKKEFKNYALTKMCFVKDYPFLENESIVNLEGFLYPETYFMEKNIGSYGAIFTILKETNKKFTPELLSIPDKMKDVIKTENDLITLASIVEKEAANENEKDIIAGVFINRLRKGMLLASCPTVEYAIGEHKDVLTDEDIKVNSPFNTYLNNGLPPYPICTPTVDTIEKVKNYKDTEYLYFLSDKNGNNIFSKTFQEHEAKRREIYDK